MNEKKTDDFIQNNILVSQSQWIVQEKLKPIELNRHERFYVRLL